MAQEFSHGAGTSQLLRSSELGQQAPKKHQAPSSKTDLRAVCPGICFWGLGLEIWNFSGAWGLVLGVSLGGGSKAKMRPALFRKVVVRRPEMAVLRHWIIALKLGRFVLNNAGR